MICRVCQSDRTAPLWNDKHGCQWHHCMDCGGDSNEVAYQSVVNDYGTDYNLIAETEAGGYEGYIKTIQSNLSWFESYKMKVRKYDFLDVGCGNGGMLREMQARGWSVHGFEIFKPSYFGPHVTVAPVFTAALFPQQYDAVLCRETLEHVDDWVGLLTEISKVTAPGGLFQLQCPRPWHTNHHITYQKTHLQAIPPHILEQKITEKKFAILDKWLWEAGQAYMLQRQS